MKQHSASISDTVPRRNVRQEKLQQFQREQQEDVENAYAKIIKYGSIELSAETLAGFLQSRMPSI